MRITGGQFKNRKISVPKVQAVRPTSEKMRQAIFNLLAHASWGMDIEDCTVIDGFCGSGIMGAECLSRGASFVHFIDSDARVLSSLIQTLSSLNLAKGEHYNSYKLDLTKKGLPCACESKADLVFIDPPYHKKMIEPSLAQLAPSMKIGGLCLFEAEKTMQLDALPNGFIQEDERQYGDSKLVALRFSGG